MSDPDYLWNKEGSDPEVESLEKSLSGLKYDRPAPNLEQKPTRARREERPPQAPAARPAQRWDRRMPLFVTSSVVKPDSASYVVNQKVLVPVQAGDPLLWSEFETTRATERLSTRVMKKARAITIDTGKATSVGGWIRPNDHVDIVGTFKDPNTNENVAVTLMQNVVILATGKITGTTNVNVIPESQREYNNVSLLVVPEEAEILVLAQDLGALTLTLRNEDDVDVIEERGRASINTLLSGERTRVLQQKRFNTIQVIRGATGSGEKKP